MRLRSLIGVHSAWRDRPKKLKEVHIPDMELRRVMRHNVDRSLDRYFAKHKQKTLWRKTH